MLSWLQVAERGLELSPEGSTATSDIGCVMPGTVDTKDLAQLRQLNLELLRQLWARQEAMRRWVAKATSEVGVRPGISQKMGVGGRARC